MTPAQRAAVVAEAATWLHTPYHHHARIKGVGVDCAQLLLAVYPALGLANPADPGFYPVDWHMHHSQEIYMHCLQAAGAVRTSVPLPGDIALFKFGRCYSHGAIVVEGGLLVHAYLGRGVIVSRASEEPLDGRLVLHWTLPGATA